jgi:lipopolysaccharide/colanic/teichoic acid biosynthesis glycosyltransferase/GT2 family glycosyltransferase
MNENPLVSIIIPARNAAKTIAVCLRAVLKQKSFTESYEVIVIDDGSRDVTAAVANGFGVRVIRLEESQGPAAARNAGAAVAKGEILVFTDSDCEPASDWLLELVKPFEDPEVVGVRGAYRSKQIGWVPRFVQQEYGFKYSLISGLDSIDFIDTYSAAYRSDVFHENHGFETAFPAPSVEDQEFSFRLARKGYRMVFAPDAEVYHWHDENLWNYLLRKFRIGYWKAFMLRWIPEKAFYDTHTPASQRAQILLLALILLSSVLGIFWSWVWLVPLVAFLTFLITALHISVYIALHDSALIPMILPMVLLRAGALGFGLFCGFFFRDKKNAREKHTLSLRSRILKRLFDILGSLAGLILTLPITLVAVLAIKLNSPGPVLFSHERIGENGKVFKMHKLRTMIVGAENQVAQVLATNPLQGPVFKIPDDPRVTRVGRFLRRWSLDEIPQLWNVLRGEMSLVGPRPEETWVVAEYNDVQRLRLAIKPGLTGPMQVSGRGDLDMDERLDLELDYIENYSILEDLKILAKSLPAVLAGKGAY